MRDRPRLYGWDDGKIYFYDDENRKERCVTDEPQLLGTLTKICQRYFAKKKVVPHLVTQDLLKEITQKIVSRFNPEKVILFGSYAWGTPHPYSDVDLLVIIESMEHPIDMEARIYLECRPRFVPMDVLVLTPEEIQKRLQVGDFFIRRILQKGRVLYERSSA